MNGICPPPPSTTAVLAASPGAAEEQDARWPSPPSAGEQTQASAKPEGMILTPQSWGDPGVPVHKGTKPSLEVAGPAGVSSRAAFNTVLCLKRLQSRSDARLGTKHGVGLNDAAAVLTLPLCVCVCVCVCTCVCVNLGRRGLLGAQEVSAGYTCGRMPGTSATGHAQGCLKAVDACSGQGLCWEPSGFR